MSEIYAAGDHQFSTNLGLALWGTDEVTTDNFLLLDAAFGSLSAAVDVNGVAVPTPNFINSATVAFTVVGSNIQATAAGGGGGVTSFSAGNLSPLFTTSVATSTTTPALSFSLTNAAQNAVFAGPATGGAGAPTYRALVATDIPALSYGTVTSVAAGTGLSASPSPITGIGTISLANTAVTPNSYTNANITVDAQGRITAASNGSGGSSTWASLTGDLTETQVIPWDGGTPGTPTTGISRIADASLAIGNGTQGDYSGSLKLTHLILAGTKNTTINSGATGADWTLTLPTTAGSSGQFLNTDGSGNTSWTDVTGVSSQRSANPWIGSPTTSRVVGNDTEGPIYQNTTATPLFVSISLVLSSGSSVSYIEAYAVSDSSSSPSQIVAANGLGVSAAGQLCCGLFFIVLPGNYYSVYCYNSGPASFSIENWTEWTCALALSAGGGAWASLTGDLTETQVIPWDGGTPGTPTTGISRIADASLAIGNGTANNYSGGLKLTTLTFADGTSMTTAPSGGGAVSTPFLMYNGAGCAMNSWSGETTNGIFICAMTIPFAITVSYLLPSTNYDVSNLYDFGIYDTAGNLICHTGPYGLAGSPATPRALVGGPITIPAGNYIYAVTCNAASGTGIFFGRDNAAAGIPGYTFACGTASSGGTLPSTIAPGSLSYSSNYAYRPVVVLY